MGLILIDKFAYWFGLMVTGSRDSGDPVSGTNFVFSSYDKYPAWLPFLWEIAVWDTKIGYQDFGHRDRDLGNCYTPPSHQNTKHFYEENGGEARPQGLNQRR